MNLKLIKKRLFKSFIIYMTLSAFFNTNIYSQASESTIDKYKISINNFGSSSNEYFNDVCTSSDGGFIAVGDTVSLKGGLSNKGAEDAVIIKYNSEGSYDWYRIFGGSDIDSFQSVTELVDGSIIAVGHTKSTDAGVSDVRHFDATIVKYNSSGSRIWIKSITGVNYEGLKCVIPTKDGGFIVSGGGNSKVLFAKYNADGTEEWKKTFGKGTDYFNSIKETKDGGIIAVGSFNANSDIMQTKGLQDGMIVKYNAQGTEEWYHSIGGSGTDELFSVIETENGDFIAVGRTSSTDAEYNNVGGYTSIIVKYDKLGNQKWIKTFGGTSYDEFNSIIDCGNNTFIATGYSYSRDGNFTNLGGYDGIAVKYDTNGNELDVINIGGSSDDYFKSAVKYKNSILIVGESSSIDAGFNNKGGSDCIMVELKEITPITIATDLVEIAENNLTVEDLSNAREAINQLEESEDKKKLQDRLNSLSPNISLESKTASANLDLYIKSENMLSMTLDTNSIIFEDFSGVDDIEQLNAINISINSSLPYQINAYLVNPIQDINNSHTMDISILNIKESGESNYKTFTDINDKLILKDNCDANNDIVHGVDIKLKGGIANPKDNYKTVIKFEAEQK